jgi:phosphoribosyl 1,2-cyclic phosphate phosphodiesterase
MHYRLPIIGFKIGNLAYITDAKEVPQSTIDKIRGIDTLIINALRITEHMSHMNLAQALQVVNAVNPRIAYFTHMSHGIGLHSHTSNSLPTNVHLAYDGLSITIPDAE